ncbi:MAG: LVIVD repeat-containing protein [Actinomycetota bacterium]
MPKGEAPRLVVGTAVARDEEGDMQIRRRCGAVAAVVAVVAAVVPAGAGAHPGQHGPPAGDLIVAGDWGELEFVSSLRLTDEPEQVADVAVDPQGSFAYLAHWGEEDCDANAETGGVNDPDAGAYVVDIRDPANPRQIGFIPHSQDSRPGEGMQVVSVTTKSFSGDVLVMNNEQCGKNGKGGISLWDVTTPTRPKKLSEHFGDRGHADTNDIHAAFAWDAGANAYAVMTDNFEATDVDILDITNPKRPRLISEMNVNALTRALGDRVSQSDIGLGDASLHDMIVKSVSRSSVGLSGPGNVWVLLLSYWDGGYVLFDVNNPASPLYIDDTDYAPLDPEMLDEGKSVFPEGNGHQAEFTADDRYFIGTDEDFSPYGALFQITSGPNAGTYPAGHFGWTEVIPPGTDVTGQPSSAVSAAPTTAPRSRPRLPPGWT